MASTAEATRLTAAHRLAQARLGVQTIAQVLLAWKLLDLEDLDGSFDRWLGVLSPLVQARRSTSARVAANYITTIRTLELGVGVGRFVPTLAETADRKALATSLLVTGPLTIKSGLARGLTLAKATENAKVRSTGAAMRFVLNGGRDTVTDAVQADRRAVGWARVTSGSPCDFCSMLARRGAVYKEETADFPAHDHCSCGVEPLYR